MIAFNHNIVIFVFLVVYTATVVLMASSKIPECADSTGPQNVGTIGMFQSDLKRCKEEAQIFPKDLSNETQLSIDEHNEIVANLLHKLRTVSAMAKVPIFEQQMHEFENGRLKDKPPKPYKDHNDLRPRSLCRKNSDLRICSFNIWHTTPPWELRLKKMVEMFVNTEPHIIALQEVRSCQNESQLDILVEELKQKGLNYNTRYFRLMEGEGLAILSVFPILSSQAFPLIPDSHKSDPSRDHRVLGHVTVDLRNALGKGDNYIPDYLSVFVTHFSLSDIGQCETVCQVHRILSELPQDTPQILMGDLNGYFDFEWPIDFLTDKHNSWMTNSQNPCSKTFSQYLSTLPETQSSTSLLFDDVWTKMHGYEYLGLTYTNFRDFRIQDSSRPDRIFVRNFNSVELCDVEIMGYNGFEHQNSKMFASDHNAIVAHFANK